MPTLRTLIVGAYGKLGQSLVPHLLAMGTLDLVLAGRSASQAHALAQQLSSRILVGSDALFAQRNKTPNLSWREFDAGRGAKEMVADLAMAGINLVVNLAPISAPKSLTLARAALTAGAHYVDLHNTASAGALAPLGGLALKQNLTVAVDQAGQGAQAEFFASRIEGISPSLSSVISVQVLRTHANVAQLSPLYLQSLLGQAVASASKSSLRRAGSGHALSTPVRPQIGWFQVGSMHLPAQRLQLKSSQQDFSGYFPVHPVTEVFATFESKWNYLLFRALTELGSRLKGTSAAKLAAVFRALASKRATSAPDRLVLEFSTLEKSGMPFVHNLVLQANAQNKAVLFLLPVLAHIDALSRGRLEPGLRCSAGWRPA